MSDSEVFVDGLLNVTMVKGLVRLDFFSLSATEIGKDGQPAPEFKQRLILNPQSMLEVFQSLQVAIMALSERGVINMRPVNDQPVPLPVVNHGSPVATPVPTIDASQQAPTPSDEAHARRVPKSRNFPSTLGN